LRGRDPLTRLSRGPDRRAFAEAFGRSEVLFLSIPLAEGLDPSSLTPEALLAHVEKAAQAISEESEIRPFTYPAGGMDCLPIFTSQGLAEQFVGEYVREINLILPFSVLTVEGTVIIPAVLASGRVVLNDRTKDRYELTDEDRALIKEVWC
jgi:hypothetical protein